MEAVDGGDLKPEPCSDLVCVGAGGDDHVLCDHIVLFGLKQPIGTVPLRRENSVSFDDSASGGAGCSRQCERRARRIHMPVERSMERSDDSVCVVVWMQLFHGIGTDKLHRQAQAFPDAEHGFQPIEFIRVPSNAESAAFVPPDALAGLRFRFLVAFDACVVDPTHHMRADRMRDLAGRVPRGPGGQLGFFQEHGVRPSIANEMVERGSSHDSAADDRSSCVNHCACPRRVLPITPASFSSRNADSNMPSASSINASSCAADVTPDK